MIGGLTGSGCSAPRGREAGPGRDRARIAGPRPLPHPRGKAEDGSFGAAFRVSAHEAWDYPSLELRAGNSWPGLILDCDRLDGTERLGSALVLFGVQLGPPSIEPLQWLIAPIGAQPTCRTSTVKSAGIRIPVVGGL